MKILVALYFLPLLASLVLALPFRLKEKWITRFTTLSLLIPAGVSFLFLIGPWKTPFEENVATLRIFSHSFPMIVWVDRYSLAMLGLTHILGLFVIRYSHHYLHLEKGFQRFFSTICLFIFGMYLISLSGSMDLFFAGWEIVGMSSFLLVAFYRAHNRSVMNAWRIYNIYRVCDLGLLLGAVIGHVLWHEATRFSVLSHLTEADFEGVKGLAMTLISLLLILASLGKSAQFPFHTWPSRAMEGPTPSSAIFYGALSIHAGVFLLIRSHAIWSHHIGTQVLVGVIGFITILLSSFQGRVQSNIKGQIAFASTAQIGLMFIELSFGLIDLVTIHMFCHALYRCFQLLVSPSIVMSSLGRQNQVVMQRISGGKSWMDRLPVRLRSTLFVLSLNDFGMDPSSRGFRFLPWKRIQRDMVRIVDKPLSLFLFSLPLAFMPIGGRWAICLGVAAMWFALRALLRHQDAFLAMFNLFLSLAILVGGVMVLDPQLIRPMTSYLTSVLPVFLIALFVTHRFREHDLWHFHGLGSSHPAMANLFFMTSLVLAGMPVSPAFFGEDLILTELISHSYLLAILAALSMMIYGLVAVKIYTRLFMGVAPLKVEEGK